MGSWRESRRPLPKSKTADPGALPGSAFLCFHSGEGQVPAGGVHIELAGAVAPAVKIVHNGKGNVRTAQASGGGVVSEEEPVLSRPVQPDVSAGGVHIQHLRPLGEGQVHLTAGGVHVELPAGDRERHVAAGGAHAARLDGQGPGDIPAGAVQLEAPGGHVLQRHVPAPAGDGDGLRPGVPQEYAAAGGLKREGLRRRAGDGGCGDGPGA